MGPHDVMKLSLLAISLWSASQPSDVSAEPSPNQLQAAIQAELRSVLAQDDGRESRWSIAFESLGERWRWSETEAGATGTDRYTYELTASELIDPPTVIAVEGGGHRVRLECRAKPCIQVRGERAGAPYAQQRRVNFWPIADEQSGRRVVELLTAVLRKDGPAPTR